MDLLGLFRLDERFITVKPSAAAPGEIDIHIKGPWLHTILFEVPVLAIVSEIYFHHTQPKPDLEEGRRRLRAKIEQINAVPEPGSFLLAGLAALGMGAYGWRRRKNTQRAAAAGEQADDDNGFQNGIG